MTILRLGRRCLRELAWFYPYLAYMRSYLRRAHQVLHLWPDGTIEIDESVALFIHYDKHGRVGDHVLAYVRTLYNNGFSVIFVSNSGHLHPDFLLALKPLCRAIVIRRNVGYDFGAIREALELFGLPRRNTRRLLIANDSVYGPLSSLEPMLARADFATADVWGATESWQHRYHLQSYFLLVGPKVMAHPAWVSFWRQVRPVSSKQWVVDHYEIGLTQKLLKAGLRCRPLWPYNELIDQVVNEPLHLDPESAAQDPMTQMRLLATRRLRTAIAHRAPLNPTADLWRQLLQAGFPFLKVELIRKNPTGVPDVADWRYIVANMPGADPEIIERDLKQKIRNRSP
jgi:ribosomal protein L30/L7E